MTGNVSNPLSPRRVIVIDDTESIHADFRKILAPDAARDDFAARAAALFGEESDPPARRPSAVFSVDSAHQGREGYDKVCAAVRAGEPYCLAFVDMRMPPGWDGLRTVEELWKEDPNLQIIICTAYSDCSLEQMVERLGASDRLLIIKKPFDTAEVAQAAIAMTEKWSLAQQALLKVEQLERLVEQRTGELRRAAMTDRLTGLPNRAEAIDTLRLAIDAHRHQREPFLALFLDCDRFKVINDSLGHEVGDLLLVDFADRVECELRDWATAHHVMPERCLAARFGGDEFVIVVRGCRCSEAETELAQRLLEVTRRPYQLRGHEVYATVSIGVTCSDFDYTSPEDVIRDADAAMYRAKASGADRAARFDRSMHATAMQRLRTEIDLRRAVERSQFAVYYQPIIDLEAGALTGFEALLRWNHPHRGVVQPAEFIHIAEETGVIMEVGSWVLREAVRQAADWRQRFPHDPPLKMSVNLSKRQMLEPGLTRYVAELLAEFELPPAALMLEVTESIVMEDPAVVTPILKDLRELGVTLAMDDFGTGHSSLSCLHRFPINVLKIDRSFIENMQHNLQYTAVVQAIITLAANLGMRVTAEGIETIEQLAQVQALECHCGQGFLFARPIPAAEIEELLAHRTTFGRLLDSAA